MFLLLEIEEPVQESHKSAPSIVRPSIYTKSSRTKVRLRACNFAMLVLIIFVGMIAQETPIVVIGVKMIRR